MASAILVVVFLLLLLRYLREQRAQEGRIATQRDLPREELLPRFYKSFVEVESKLWATTEEGKRSNWDTGMIRLCDREVELVGGYVQGLRRDFAQANRIFSVVIGRSPNAEILVQLERHRLKTEVPYYVHCARVCLYLWMNRVSMKELRLLTSAVSTMAYEVRSMLGILEQEGHVDFVEALLRKS